MDKLIKKIIEIDKKAQDIIDEAAGAENGLSESVSGEVKQIKDEYNKRLDDTLRRYQEEIKNETDAKLSALENRHKDDMEKLEKGFENSEKLTKRIFSDILEVM